MAVTYTANGSYTFTSSNSSNTISFGTATTDRLVLVCLLSESSLSNPATPTSCTIGGISATRCVESSHAGDQLVQWWVAPVPSGTTGGVVWGDNVGACGVISYSIYGADPTPIDTATYNTIGATDTNGQLSTVGSANIKNPALDLVIPTGGAGFWAAINDTPQNSTWTGPTEDYDYSADTNEVSSASTSSSGTITGQVTWTTADDFAFAAVAFAPSSASGYVKVWNGSSWVQKPIKVWNGSSWVTY